MDASLRQIGIGDYVVGKHVGRMMGALGGRLAALPRGARTARRFAAAVRAQHLPRRAALAEKPWPSSPARLGALARGGSTRCRSSDLLAGALPRMTAPEFSRPVRIDTLGAAPRNVAIEADEAERAALARRFGLIAHRPADRRARR